MSEFLQETVKPEHFWVAASALATFFAVLVALFMPAIERSRRSAAATRFILDELMRNVMLVERIVETYQQRNEDQGGLYQAALVIKATSARLHLGVWREFWRDLQGDRYQCFRPFMESIEDIMDPDMRTATSRDGKLSDEDRASIAFGMADDFLREYEKVSKRCRYFKF